MKFSPKPWQPQMIEHVTMNDRSALFCPMGSGKTIAVYTALDALFLVGDSYPVLVIAPKRVAKTVWTEEVTKWDHLKTIVVSAIVGTEQERLKALRRDASVYTINYENLPWLLEVLGGKWPFRHVVADESTKLKSFRLKQGSKRARALGTVAHSKVQRFTNLTGTPAPNGLVDLWGQTWFLDQGLRLGRSYSAFQDRWFQMVPNGQAGYCALRPLAHAQSEIEARLKDICLAVDLRDYMSLDEPIVNNIMVDLPSKARNLYRQMEREMFMQIGEHEIEAFNAASRTIKCLQLANGAAYVDDKQNWAEVHDEKLQALEEIVEEAAGAPVLCAYHFKSDLARLKKAFPKGRVLANDNEMAEFKTGAHALGFGHPASMGHGVDGLQNHCNIVAFFGHWWDLEQRQQMIERVGPVRQMQAGHDRPVFIHNIIARDTVDELVIARTETKQGVQDILLEAMKRKRGCDARTVQV